MDKYVIRLSLACVKIKKREKKSFEHEQRKNIVKNQLNKKQNEPTETWCGRHSVLRQVILQCRSVSSIFTSKYENAIRIRNITEVQYCDKETKVKATKQYIS